MPAAQYPFIDVAVHKAVRDRFARGEALVLFSADMGTVLWANGAGAAHFGKASIYDLLEQGPARQELSFRQLTATAGQLTRPGDSRALTLRIASGFRSVTTQARVELTEIRRGEPVILFSLPATPAKSTAELAARLLSGFDDPDTHMAILDGEGRQVAASTGFSGLGLAEATARGFIARAEAEPSHVLKRPLPTARGHLPAAIGKVSDTPALYLVLAVETILGNFGPEEDSQPEPPAPVSAEPTPIMPAATSSVAPSVAAAEDVPTGIDSAPLSADEHRIDTASEIESVTPPQVADVPPVDDMGEEPAPETAGLSEPLEAGVSAPEEDAPADDETAGEPVVAVAPEPAPPAMPAATAPAGALAAPAVGTVPFAFHRDGRATRFVWKIDAHGAFTEVSSEFAAAVGPRSAAIEGLAFGDLAALFDLDPEGKIGELLNRRDTWSGKTIYWPVEGTALRVPVDLAALPTYTRNREFDGFRGFGVVRMADAVEDPLRTGLSLAAGTLGQDASLAEYEADEADGETPTTGDLAAGPAMADDAIGNHDDDGFLPENPQSEIPAGEHPTGERTADQRRDEPPALYIAESHNRRASDKVIQLDDRRARGRDGLSPSEEAAFREIARKLEPIDQRQTDTTPTAADEAKSGVSASGEAGATTVRSEAADRSNRDAEQHAEPHRPHLVASTEPDEAEDDASETPPPARVVRIDTSDEFTPPAHRDFGMTAEIVDMMPVALLVHVAERLIHGNPEFLKLTGYDSLEALAEAGGIDALLQREDLDGAEGGNSRMVVVRADDILVPVSARLQSVRFGHSSALMLSLVPVEAAEARDLRSEQGASPADDAQASELARLRVETEEMRSILETATDGVVTIGADGDIRSMNRSASALFNYDDEELRGKPFVMLFAHESQRAILDYLAGLAGHGVASVLNDGREVIGREASGGFLPLFMTIGKLSSSNGYCAVIRDITQWKRTEEELRGAKRAAETANAHKSDFLARVSHEIRTPLNAIIGFADIMANEHFGPIGHPRYGEYAGDIVRSGRHVLDIVNDLLDISKIEAGEMDLDFTAVGLNETVSQAVAIVQPQANGQRVIIRTALSQAVPSVVADLRSVKQIVLNILANAIRFTPSGGQIIVSTAYEPNGSVVLRIRDTGVGMSRAELEQAMKPFRQVSTGTRPRGDGTGLGLPLTKAMVDANRATFAISSTPNEGTLVEVTFPSPRVLAD